MLEIGEQVLVVDGIGKSFAVLLIAKTIHGYVVEFAERARGSAIATYTARNGTGATQASCDSNARGIIGEPHVSVGTRSASIPIIALKTFFINHISTVLALTIGIRPIPFLTLIAHILLIAISALVHSIIAGGVKIYFGLVEVLAPVAGSTTR